MKRLWTVVVMVGLAVTAVMASSEAGAAPARKKEQVLRGTVSYVTDGDTLWLRSDDADAPPFKLRLAGIDAPERCQPHGDASRKALEARLLDRRVTAYSRAVDAHGRYIVRVRDQRGDVAEWLVAQGHAWSPGYRGRPGPYAEQEAAARHGRKGLFANAAAMPPAEFRRRHGTCRH